MSNFRNVIGHAPVTLCKVLAGLTPAKEVIHTFGDVKLDLNATGFRSGSATQTPVCPTK
jgi:hypothetical protein